MITRFVDNSGIDDHHCLNLLGVQDDQLKWQVTVGFVDIGGIVDHHCLDIIFIMF